MNYRGVRAGLGNTSKEKKIEFVERKDVFDPRMGAAEQPRGVQTAPS